MDFFASLAKTKRQFVLRLVRELNKAVASHVSLAAHLGGSGDGPHLRDELRKARRTAQEAAAAAKATLLPSLLDQRWSEKERTELERLWHLLLCCLDALETSMQRCLILLREFSLTDGNNILIQTGLEFGPNHQARHQDKSSSSSSAAEPVDVPLVDKLALEGVEASQLCKELFELRAQLQELKSTVEIRSLSAPDFEDLSPTKNPRRNDTLLSINGTDGLTNTGGGGSSISCSLPSDEKESIESEGSQADGITNAQRKCICWILGCMVFIFFLAMILGVLDSFPTKNFSHNNIGAGGRSRFSTSRPFHPRNPSYPNNPFFSRNSDFLRYSFVSIPKQSKPKNKSNQLRPRTLKRVPSLPLPAPVVLPLLSPTSSPLPVITRRKRYRSDSSHSSKSSSRRNISRQAGNVSQQNSTHHSSTKSQDETSNRKVSYWTGTELGATVKSTTSAKTKEKRERADSRSGRKQRISFELHPPTTNTTHPTNQSRPIQVSRNLTITTILAAHRMQNLATSAQSVPAPTTFSSDPSRSDGYHHKLKRKLPPKEHHHRLDHGSRRQKKYQRHQRHHHYHYRDEVNSNPLAAPSTVLPRTFVGDDNDDVDVDDDPGITDFVTSFHNKIANMKGDMYKH
ncbi:unnamed protein product [Orchesella dallaii]|uniref:Uncharacterized protein n=1 Tax=Orchesella dallaii TaxID=48710 RepID=A0ABP1QD80_9HEXA